MKEIPEKFCELIRKITYKGKSRCSLTNLTFFLGAGFSKSWDKNYPLGFELFEFNDPDWFSKCNCIKEYFQECGYDPHNHISFDAFSECNYKLQMLIKYPEIRPRYIDEQTLHIIDNEFKYLVWQNFTLKVDINYSDSDGHSYFNDLDTCQRSIVYFFHQLISQLDGSTLIPEGVRTHFVSTNYDFIIEGICDEIYKPDDYQLLLNYRGFTPVNVNGQSNINPLHNHWLVNNLIKINGGLEIFRNDGRFDLDYRHKGFKDIISNPPEIILPSKEQDYTSKYFKSIFPKITRLLQESQILIIVGYSFPKEDALLRFILRHFAEDDRDLANKFILYIDIGSEKKLREKVNSICPSGTYKNSHVWIYNKGFEKFVKAVNKIGWP